MILWWWSIKGKYKFKLGMQKMKLLFVLLQWVFVAEHWHFHCCLCSFSFCMIVGFCLQHVAECRCLTILVTEQFSPLHKCYAFPDCQFAWHQSHPLWRNSRETKCYAVLPLCATHSTSGQKKVTTEVKQTGCKNSRRTLFYFPRFLWL